MTVPVILEVLDQNPEVEIDVLTRPFTAKLFPDHPRLKAIGVDVDKKYKGIFGLWKLSSELQSNGYDAIADLHYVLRSRLLTRFLKSGRSSSHMDKGREEKKALTRKENKARGALRPMTERYADVFRALGLTVELSHILRTSKTKREGIGFAPFAQHKGKAWPLEHARELLEKLNEEGRAVKLFGGPQEQEELLSLSQGLSRVSLHKGSGIQSDIEAMSSLEVVISMDSANMHLSSLAGTPVISIWGATHPDAGFLGYGQREDHAVQISTERLGCRPCSVFGNVPCHRGDWACMQQLSSDSVLEKLKDLD